MKEIQILLDAIDTLEQLEKAVEAQKETVTLLQAQLHDAMKAQGVGKITINGVEVSPKIDYKPNRRTVLQTAFDDDDSADAEAKELLDFLKSIQQDGLLQNVILIPMDAGDSDFNNEVLQKISKIEGIQPSLRGEIHHQTAKAFLRRMLEDPTVINETKEKIRALFKVYETKTVSIKKAR